MGMYVGVVIMYLVLHIVCGYLHVYVCVVVE